jgi:putative transposase
LRSKAKSTGSPITQSGQCFDLIVTQPIVVNRKRVWRLWKREGFKVPQKQRTKRRLGCSANGIARHRTEHKDHVWAWDFIHDRDRRNRPRKWFTRIDEYTRECLALEAERSMTALEGIDLRATGILPELRHIARGV